jgi:hypothetical protein
MFKNYFDKKVVVFVIFKHTMCPQIDRSPIMGQNYCCTIEGHFQVKNNNLF